MNRLLQVAIALALSCGSLLAQDRFPAPQKAGGEAKAVHDYIGLLDPAEREQLNDFLISYADTTSTQIAVVIIDSLKGEDPNLYAAELGQAWGVGQKKAENGLIFLIAKSDRQLAIQNGYGLEQYLTDAKTKLIIENYITPYFKKDRYFEGIRTGTIQIVKVLEGQFDGQPQANKERKSLKKYFPLLIIIILSIIYFLRRRNHGNGPGGGYRGGGGVWIGGFGGSSFGGGGGSFGGGGGFSGGFGGGGFGGGGASGSW